MEGAEFTALSGCAERLRQDRPVIGIEVSSALLASNSGVPAVEFLRFLQAIGYDVAVIRSGADIACSDAEAVMALYDRTKGDHIDAVFPP